MEVCLTTSKFLTDLNLLPSTVPAAIDLTICDTPRDLFKREEYGKSFTNRLRPLPNSK